MHLQSPPFWCLMTIHEFAVLINDIVRNITRTATSLQNKDRAPPGDVHNHSLHLNTNAHQSRINTPPLFYKQTTSAGKQDTRYHAKTSTRQNMWATNVIRDGEKGIIPSIEIPNSFSSVC